VPRIPHRLPARLGGLAVGAFVPSGIAWDVVIGGVPFLAAYSEQDPHIRETADFKREQQDQSAEAGEQSLSGWWFRSQSSFHGGAGLNFLEVPGDSSAPTGRIRFDDSVNVDVWTPGKVTRLPDTTLVIPSGSTGQKVAAARKGTVDYVLHAAGSTLTTLNIDAAGVTTTTVVSWGGTGTILALATDGLRYFVANSLGIWSGPVDNSVAGAKLYDLTSPTSVVLAWVKQRLMACVDRAVYELTTTGPALPAAKYTHPTTGWVWTAISEDPAAILAAGFAGGTSGIVRFAIDTAGATPTLTAGGEVAQLPAGEVVRSLHLHAGSFLGIGTTRGMRVGTFDTFSGRLAYGPLTLPTSTPAPVLAVTSRGDFMYAGASRAIDTTLESGLLRVDLGQQLDQAGHFAYANDLICDGPTFGDVSGVDVTAGGRIAFCVDGKGLLLEGVGPGSNRPAWLRTSRIRYSTGEAKVFRHATVSGLFAAPGQITVMVSSPGLQEAQVLAWSSFVDPGEFSLVDGPRKWIQLRFLLDGDDAVELHEYAVKALPAVKRQRMLQYVLLCNDREQDRQDQRFDRPGYASSRIQQLEALEDTGDETTVQEFLPGESSIIRRCVIDRVTYRQTSRPTRTGGRGGILVVLARTVA
jgi:hypothetical protein